MLALAAAAVIPWLPASPPAPAQPAVASPCRVGQLHVGVGNLSAPPAAVKLALPSGGAVR